MTILSRQNIYNVEGIARTIMNEEYHRTLKVSVLAGLVDHSLNRLRKARMADSI
jgi:hypothetical protein